MIKELTSGYLTEADVIEIVRDFAKEKGIVPIGDFFNRRIARVFLSEYTYFVYSRGRRDEKFEERGER